MQRSGGITASAIVVLIGSGVFFLLGIITALTLFLSPKLLEQGQQAAQPAFPVAIQVAMPVFLLLWHGGLAAWGIATAIGLLRLRPWARISILVFSALLLALILFAGVLVWIITAWLPEVQDPPEALAMTRAILLLIYSAPAGVAVWWLVYFSRSSVRQQFHGAARAASSDAGTRPLSITLLAWLMVGSGASFPLFFFIPQVFLFGYAIEGWAGGLIGVVWTLALVVAGVGLLLRKPAAHTLALCLSTLHLLHSTVVVLIPGSLARFLEVSAKTYGDLPTFGTGFLRALMIGSVVFCMIPLWILITRRQRYLESCKRGPSLP